MPDIKLPLAQAGSHFTVKTGTGPAAHNLGRSLHLATLTSSSYLHPVKNYIDSITDVFNNPVVKKEIREGGLNPSMQKLLWRRLQEKHPEITTNVLVKDRIKKIIQHYGKNTEAENVNAPAHHAPPPTATATVGSISASQLAQKMQQNPADAPHIGIQHNAVNSVADLGKKNINISQNLSAPKTFKPLIPLIK